MPSLAVVFSITINPHMFSTQKLPNVFAEQPRSSRKSPGDGKDPGKLISACLKAFSLGFLGTVIGRDAPF